MSKTYLEALTSVGKNLQSGIDKLNNAKIDLNVMEIEGIEGNGINDDGAVITAYIANSTDEQLSLYFPPSKIFRGDITISRGNVNITGKGTINGTLKCDFETETYADIRINDVKIKPYMTNGSIESKSKPCVLLKNTRNIHFLNVDFYFGFAGIKIADIEVQKHSGCMTINACRFNHCVYDLYSVSETYTGFLLMDTSITNCQMYSTKITSIMCKGVDGLILKGNTLFMAGYQVKETDKKNNINIDNSNFVSIEGNNLFESGEESIIVKNVRNMNIQNNNIAWAGETVLSAAIKIVGSTVSKTDIAALMRCNISNNTIDNSTLYGIDITGYVQGLTVECNSIMLNTGTYFYGTGTYSVDNLRAIRVDPMYGKDCSILISNNNYYNNNDEIGDYPNVKCYGNLSAKGITNRGNSILTLTDTQYGATILNYTSSNAFSKNDRIIIPAERTADLSFVSIGGNEQENRKIMIINDNSTATITIKHNGTTNYPFYTKSGTDIAMPEHSIMQFIFVNSAWYEI